MLHEQGVPLQLAHEAAFGNEDLAVDVSQSIPRFKWRADTSSDTTQPHQGLGGIATGSSHSAATRAPAVRKWPTVPHPGTLGERGNIPFMSHKDGLQRGPADSGGLRRTCFTKPPGGPGTCFRPFLPPPPVSLANCLCSQQLELVPQLQGQKFGNEDLTVDVSQSISRFKWRADGIQ